MNESEEKYLNYLEQRSRKLVWKNISLYASSPDFNQYFENST